MKKNGLRRITAVLIVLTAAALFGCGNSAKEEKQEAVNKSTFIERETKLPDQAGSVLDTVIFEDKALGMACFNEETMEGSIWKSDDGGKTWNKQSIFTENLPLNKKKDSGQQWAAVLSPKGDVLFSRESWEAEDQSSYFISAADKKVLKLKETGIQLAEFAQDGSLIFQSTGKGKAVIRKLEPKSGTMEQIADLETDTANVLCCQEEELYIFTNEQCLGFSLERGKEIQVPDAVRKAAEGVDNSANFENTDPQKFRIVKDKESGAYEVYSMTKKGILRYGQKEEEQLISGSETCLYTNTTALHSFEVLNENTFFAAADCDGKNTLFSYIYAPDKVGKKTELQMYMLTEEPVFEKIISFYERKNPSVKIQVTVGMEKERSLTRSDAVKALNTELLAGTGPDILCLSDMPVENFMNNGLLEDLTKTITEADQKEKLFTNITGCYKKDGKLYAVPTQFSFICAGGTKQVVQAAGNLNQLMDRLDAESKKTPALSEDTFNLHVLMLYQTFLAGNEKEKKALSQEKLKGFYSQIRRMYDWYGNPRVLEQPDSMQELGLQPKGYPSPVQYVTEGASAQICFLNEIGDLATIKALNNQKQVNYRCLGAQGSSMFLPQHIMGVSSKSGHKKEAGDFISFLLSSQGQERYYGPGFYSPGISVNQEFAETETAHSSGFIVEGLESETLSKGERGKVMEFLLKPSIPADTDSLFKDIVMEHLQSYLKGDKSLEQAASDAMKRLKLYLAEQE